MPGENIQDWSVTATDNGNSDSSINWAEGQPRASVNNSARSMMAAHAKQRNLLNGSIVTGGSANAQTFTSGVTYTTVPTGLRVMLKIGPSLTNTAAATLEMDGLGTVAVKNQLGFDVAPGTLFAGAYSEFIYNGTNWIAMAAAAGALENIRVFTASGTYPTTTVTCKVLAYCKGAGASGGCSSLTTANGGGGGEGAESWLLTTAAALSGLAVTVGDGGTGVAGGNDGIVGGASSIGTIVTASGGSGGSRGEFGGSPGLGGSSGTGSFVMPGAAGQAGADENATIGINSAGGGKGGGIHGGAGVANSGGGGGGGGTVVSGAGGSGIVVCYEYGVI